MQFRERKNPPAKLVLPGWERTIAYDKLRASFPKPRFVLAFGSALRGPQIEKHTSKLLFWSIEKEKTRYAADVDFLVVTEEQLEPYQLRNGMPCWFTVGDSYSWHWVVQEVPGAMHLQITTLAHLEQAVIHRDQDAINILSSCEVIEGDVTEARRLIAAAMVG